MGSNPSYHKITQTESIRNQSGNSDNQPIASSRRPMPSNQPPDRERRAEPAQTKQSNSDMLVWPLPPNDHGDPFKMKSRDPNRYLLTPLSPRHPTPDDHDGAAARELHNERETLTEDWVRIIPDSQQNDSAHVQSQLSARFHACFNLSAADNINVVMANLKSSQQGLQQVLQRRLLKVSTESEQKIQLVVEDTREDQKLLLMYDKERQRHQNAVYQEWLQKYIVKLNEWRSRQLANLQKELLHYQKAIVDTSRRRIDKINLDTYLLQAQILQEETDANKTRTDNVTKKMYEITREGENFLGSESKVELNLKIQANVGEMAPGQSCVNDFPDDKKK